MSDLRSAIHAQADAADALTRACARQGALADWIANHNPLVSTLRRAYRKASPTPADMIATLGKLK